jgi:hypothetical protein
MDARAHLRAGLEAEKLRVESGGALNVAHDVA